MRWEEFYVNSGRFGEVCRKRLVKPGVLLVATIRRDGTPRLSPVEPLILDGELWLSMMWNSKKAADIDRDDRILVHSIVTGPQDTGGEVKVRGRVIPKTTSRRAGASARRWRCSAGSRKSRTSTCSESTSRT